MVLIMWIIALLSVCLFGGAVGLRLIDVDVPSHANLGDSVSLKCEFDLGSGRLYSVKWYKDDSEFYRYMPDNIPQTQVFALDGINLDGSQSDMNRVTLTQVEYKSSGAYRCEVSTEAPNFDTVFRGSNMTVLAYPDQGPEITGVLDSYSVGEYVTANCSSGRSNPSPKLSWFINGMKADSWLLDKYPQEEHSGPLYSRALGLRFQVEKRRFIGPGSTIVLKCTSTVADLPAESSSKTTRLASSTANQKLAQERLHNRGNTRFSESWILLVPIFGLIPFST